MPKHNKLILKKSDFKPGTDFTNTPSLSHRDMIIPRSVIDEHAIVMFEGHYLKNIYARCEKVPDPTIHGYRTDCSDCPKSLIAKCDHVEECALERYEDDPSEIESIMKANGLEPEYRAGF